MLSENITLGQVSEALAAVNASEAQLQALGFTAPSAKALKDAGATIAIEDTKRMGQARLYAKSDVPHMRAAVAQKMLTLNLEDAKKRAISHCQ